MTANMNELQQLQNRVKVLEDFIKSLQASHSIPLAVDMALRARLGNTSLQAVGVLGVSNGGTGAATLTGILKGNGTSAVTAVVPLAGGKIYWVADSSGGAVNRKLTFTDGILTAET